MAGGSEASAAASFVPLTGGRRLLFVVTIGVLGCAAAPSSLETGTRGTSAAAFSSQLGRRLLFVVTTDGASIATAFRFLGGRLSSVDQPAPATRLPQPARLLHPRIEIARAAHHAWEPMPGRAGADRSGLGFTDDEHTGSMRLP